MSLSIVSTCCISVLCPTSKCIACQNKFVVSQCYIFVISCNSRCYRTCCCSIQLAVICIVVDCVSVCTPNCIQCCVFSSCVFDFSTNCIVSTCCTFICAPAKECVSKFCPTHSVCSCVIKECVFTVKCCTICVSLAISCAVVCIVNHIIFVCCPNCIQHKVIC